MDAIEIIRLTAKEFSSVSDEDLVKWVEIAKPWVSKKLFGKLYEQALAYLICHKMKLNGLGEDDGFGNGVIKASMGVSSYSEGETSISFSASPSTNIQTDAEYALTIYGMQFLELRRSVIVPIRCAGEI